MAGKEDWPESIPYEELGNSDPAWRRTQGLVPAFSEASPLLGIPYDSINTASEAVFRFDVFHNYHLGVGKNYISSAVVMVMELIPTSIEQAFQQLTADFQAYCKRMKESPYHKRLTAVLFGVHTGFQECPDGGWSKGDFTRLLHLWFADYCSREVIGKTQDPVYLMCAEATAKINEFIGGLYHEGIFIKPERAQSLAESGLSFLQLYLKLARCCFERRQKRFPIMPKCHYLHHQMLDVLEQGRAGKFAVNCLVYSCQMQEDFVGRPSRLARRVSSRTTAMRVIQRLFLSIRSLGD
ncbi:unnamed protein product [Durusdinium trenchii]|uniref:Uncharacterized protein n=2 Tax=Durusdinium trenchii TaxID=1381693 RepID=A0ABP0NW63_9DINO